MTKLKIFLLLFLQTAAVGCEEAKILPVSPGDDITLPCHAPLNVTVILVEWTRPDLVSPEYVFLYRDDSSYTSFQRPSFMGRVQLKDRQMKGGDVSIVLRNVSLSDDGVYECRVSQGGLRSGGKANIKTEPISIIDLKVKGIKTENSKRSHVGFGASLVVFVVMTLMLVAKISQQRNHF